MEYEECWTVVRVRDDAEASPGFAAARLARGGVYGRRWQVIGWLQDVPTDYQQAFQHGVSVHGERAFARALFPVMTRGTSPSSGRGRRGKCGT
jgi:hypothetical protein